jgi:hypothetical protein
MENFNLHACRFIELIDEGIEDITFFGKLVENCSTKDCVPDLMSVFSKYCVCFHNFSSLLHTFVSQFANITPLQNWMQFLEMPELLCEKMNKISGEAAELLNKACNSKAYAWYRMAIVHANTSKLPELNGINNAMQSMLDAFKNMNKNINAQRKLAIFNFCLGDIDMINKFINFFGQLIISMSHCYWLSKNVYDMFSDLGDSQKTKLNGYGCILAKYLGSTICMNKKLHKRNNHKCKMHLIICDFCRRRLIYVYACPLCKQCYCICHYILHLRAIKSSNIAKCSDNKVAISYERNYQICPRQLLKLKYMHICNIELTFEANRPYLMALIKIIKYGYFKHCSIELCRAFQVCY